MLINRIIAQCPKNSKHLCQDFNLNQDQLQKGFLPPHGVAFEPYQKAFQYKVLNSVLFTNKKLNIHYVKRIRNPFTTSFSKADTPSRFGRNFNITFTHWQENSSVWPYKTLLQEYYIQIALLLLNYLILIAKLYLWGCRRNQTLPVITAFSSKVKTKYETEKCIRVKTNKMDNFNKKWALPLDSVP